MKIRQDAARLDADRIRETARGRWPVILARLGVPSELLTGKHAPCPGCGGRDRFRFDDHDGRGTWICSQGGGEPAAGDGFALLQHVNGWPFPEALKAVADVLGITAAEGQQPPPQRTPPPTEPPRRTQLTLTPEWQARWRKASSIIRDSPAGHYLIQRGCALPPEGADIGWHPRVQHWQSGHIGPAMVALITDPRSSRPVSLHMTWLATDGSGKADLDDYKNKLTIPGHSNVGIIRLYPDQSITMGLGIAEGIETALTAARCFVPVWAAVNSSNLAKFPRLPGIEALTIFADADHAGRKAAAVCAERWRELDAEVRIVAAEPADGG